MPKTDWTWFSKEGFFNLSTSGIWGLIIHCSVRGSPAHCDWFSSIPGLYSLDSRKITPLLPQVMVIRVIFRHYQVSPSGERQSPPPPIGNLSLKVIPASPLQFCYLSCTVASPFTQNLLYL